MNLYEIEFFKIYEDGRRVRKCHQTCVKGGEWDACTQLGQIFNSGAPTGEFYEIEIVSVRKVS